MRPPLIRKRKLIFEHQLQYFYCMKKNGHDPHKMNG